MQFNCDYSNFHPDLKDQFGLECFLKLIQIKSTFLSHYKLDILSEQDASERYDQISKCLTRFSPNQLDKIIEYFNQIPNIDYLLDDAKHLTLDQIQCKQLADFCIINKKVCQLEDKYTSSNDSLNNDAMLEILRTHLLKGYSGFKPTNILSELKSSLDNVNLDLQVAVKEYENEIFNSTGLRLYYPYLKEIPYDDQLLDKISDCPLLKYEKKTSILILDYCPTKAMLELQAHRNKSLELYNHEAEQIQSLVNQDLQPYLDTFSNYITKRKHDLLIYSLSFFVRRLDLCVPKFQSNTVKFENARLYALEQNTTCYKPLNLDTDMGTSILFGSNMTGKTSVLKTLYFQFSLMKLGIPLPAKSVTSFYPNNILLNLKSSGSIVKKLSSFGEEIQFWTQDFNENSVILCDELFLNTEPSAGEIISQTIIDYVKTRKLFFMASSHYTNLIHCTDVNLFYMKSILSKDNLDKHSLFEQIPFELAPLKKDDKLSLQNMKNEAFETALCFDIPDEIKNQLLDYMKGQ